MKRTADHRGIRSLSWEGSAQEIEARCERLARKNSVAGRRAPWLLLGGLLGGSCQFIVGMALHSVWLVLAGVTFGVLMVRRGVGVLRDDIDDRKLAITRALVASLGNDLDPATSLHVDLHLKNDWDYDEREPWLRVHMIRTDGTHVDVRARVRCDRTALVERRHHDGPGMHSKDLVGFESERVESVLVRLAHPHGDPLGVDPGTAVPELAVGPLELRRLSVDVRSLAFEFETKELIQVEWTGVDNPLPPEVVPQPRDLQEAVAAATRWFEHLREDRLPPEESSRA